jgi:hypothetical protein
MNDLPSDTKTVQTILNQLYEAWMQAATVHDDNWYMTNLANEFHYFSAGGAIATREEMIAIANISQNSEYKLFEVSGQRYGDILLAYGRYFGKGDFPEDKLVNESMRKKYGKGAELRFTGTWVLRDSRWQSLHLQTTEVG